MTLQSESVAATFKVSATRRRVKRIAILETELGTDFQGGGGVSVVGVEDFFLVLLSLFDLFFISPPSPAPPPPNVFSNCPSLKYQLFGAFVIFEELRWKKSGEMEWQMIGLVLRDLRGTNLSCKLN